MKKLIIFLLSMLLLPVVLLACDASDVADGGASTTGEETPGILSVIAAGKTDYTIVVEKAIQTRIREDLDYMTRVMDRKFGAHPAIAEQAEGKKIEILYADKPDSMDWHITVGQDGNIQIAAPHAYSISRAMKYFITNYLAYAEGDLLLAVGDDASYTYREDRIDNSAFLSYKGGAQTTLAPSDEQGLLMTPTWLDTAVMVEVRLDMASIGGTFKDSTDLIDFYAETGVNVIWLTPVYERGGGNGYSNTGLHRIEPALTGTDDQEKGWNELKKFVDYAHGKGVYVLLDLITWGTMKDAPLVSEHPDWFAGDAWGNRAFNWKNREFVEWFISNAVANIEKTGADGYRCDCEPNYAGYAVFGEIRKRLNDKGIFPVIIAEDGAERRDAFDMEQDGVLKYSALSRGELYRNPVNFFADGLLDIVSSVKKGIGIGGAAQQANAKYSGTYRYYTNCITNHDYQSRNVNGNRLKIGYSAIYAPFIPLWYMGDEFGVTYEKAVLYDIRVDYSPIGSDIRKTYFYEDVKQMLAIRRSYPEVFEQYPLNHRRSNICKVEVEGLVKLDNYARYGDGKAVLVIANNEEGNDGICRVEVPFKTAFGSEKGRFRVTDLLSGRAVVTGDSAAVNHFSAIVPYQYCGVYLVERIAE